MSKQVPAVIYAALSKKEQREEEEKDRERGESISSQIEEIAKRLEQVGGRVLVGEFTDDGYSGSKRSRGPDLERAISAAVDAAERDGHAELWAVASSRFGRGSGRLGEARAIGKLFYELREKGVALRTVHDDEFVTNEMLIGFASRQSSKYAEDLSASVKRSKHRDAKAGKRLGGPWPLGYSKDGAPAVARATVERIFALAEEGVPDSALARTINAEGLRTRRGRPFDRRAVQAIVTNPTYAALVIHEGVENEGHWQPLVDRETWRRIQRQRAKRDLGVGQHVKGRPARRHLLASLARCGECGSPMFAITSSYRRKDGGKARQYACRSYRNSDGTCDAKPVDAEAVDRAVLEALPRLLPDFDTWIAQIEDRHAAERRRLEEQRDRALRDRDNLAEKVRKAEDRFLDADDEDQERMRDALDRRRDELQRAEVRAQASSDASASLPEEVGHDRLLDFAISLREVIAARVESGGSVEQINRQLIELFNSFTICHELPDGILHEEVEAALTSGRLYVFPNLRVEVFWRLVAEYEEAQRKTGDQPRQEAEPVPPLEWIEALAFADDKSANPQP